MTPKPILSVTQLLESRVHEFPNGPVVGVPDDKINFRIFTYSELDRASSRLAHYYADRGDLPIRPSGDTTSQRVIAFFSPSGFEYAVHELAFLKLGYTVCLLSPSNSIPALVHLLKETASSFFVVHSSLVDAAQEVVAYVAGEPLTCAMVPQAPKDAWDNDKSTEFRRPLTPEQEAPLLAFIIHSSGSTGFPKPIFLTHKATVANVSVSFNLTAFTTLPLYHNHGHSCFYRAIASNKPLYLFPSTLPLTTVNITHCLNKLPEIEGFYAVPYVIKLLGDDERGINLLKSFKLVTYGGAPCPNELGDKLVRKHGVKLVGHYGTTETGQLMTSLRDCATDLDWNYVRATGPVLDYLVMKPQPGGTLECIIQDGWPPKVAKNLPDGSFATKDLFLPHPTIPHAYKHVGRIDDTLVMVNGEKTNPVPIELTISGESPYISEAIVFGEGKPQTGVILLPTEAAKEMTTLELFRLVWPVIKLANDAAPSHSRLLPEMLIFLPFDTPIPRADKRSFIRRKVYSQFADLIEAAYIRFDNGESYVPGEEKKKVKLGLEALPEYIAKTISATMASSVIGYDEDLFSYGVDSLQAARIRQILQRELDLGGRKLPANVIFEHASVNRLALYIHNLKTGSVDPSADDYHTNQIELMQQLVQKYTNFVAVPNAPEVNGANGNMGDVVVLTGTTGGLGAHLLDRFLAEKMISVIFCLVRAPDDDAARTRVSHALVQRGLPSLDDRTDADRVIALSSVLHQEDLGLDNAVYAKIRDTVSIVVHNAWAVDFNMGVESFEPHIKSLQNLINLSIVARQGHSASIFFSSSISAVAAAKAPTIDEVTSHDPLQAQGMGYARSKWVAEQLCELAGNTRGIRAEVFRLGQMVGDTSRGIWNETEAIPLMIKSAQIIGTLPALDETLSWLPVDLAARACVELALKSPPVPTPNSGVIWHILNHDESTSWSDILSSLREAGIKFDVVPQRDWVRQLRESNPDPAKNPTIKLLSFFESKYNTDQSTKRGKYLTNRTIAASSVAASFDHIDDSLIGMFVAAWKQSRFLA